MLLVSCPDPSDGAVHLPPVAAADHREPPLAGELPFSRGSLVGCPYRVAHTND